MQKQLSRTYTPTHTPQAPPTYLLLVGEYMATLEYLISLEPAIPPFIRGQAVNRLAFLAALQVHDIDAAAITHGLPAGTISGSKRRSENPVTP